jgi:hypothetical protein
MKMSEKSIRDTITELLESVNKKQALSILAEILDEEYDLTVASNLVKNDCEPDLCKILFEEKYFGEGNEEAGFIGLRRILDAAEEIINCDNSCSDIEFTYFVRPETDAEKEVSGNSKNMDWYVEDKTININELEIQFQNI